MMINMNPDQFLFTEKYRPNKVEDCILPLRLKAPFQEYVKKGQIPNLLLSGGPGVGKTTVAIAMCKEIGLSYMLIPSSSERGIDVLRTKISSYASTNSLNGTKKVIILDEADGITPDAQNAFRGVIEEFSKNCSFIFTCNFKKKIMDAIHSRCINVDFGLKTGEHAEMAMSFYKRVLGILDLEKIQYDRKVVIEIVKRYFPDFRRTLNELQHLSNAGPIDAGALASVSAVGDVSEVFTMMKNKEFGEMRRWLVKHKDVPSEELFKRLYEKLDTHVQKPSIPAAIIILARYDYQRAFVSDQELNTLAALTEIMLECDFNG